MTLSRRLTALEAALSPTELVLRWLSEAHGFGDLESYVRSLLAEPPPEGPLDRLAREAAQGVRSGFRGKRPEVVDAAVRSTLRETVFRFELVMRINVTVQELLEREGLIEAVLSAHLTLLTSEDREHRRGDATYLERFATLRGRPTGGANGSRRGLGPVRRARGRSRRAGPGDSPREARGGPGGTRDRDGLAEAEVSACRVRTRGARMTPFAMPDPPVLKGDVEAAGVRLGIQRTECAACLWASLSKRRRGSSWPPIVE